jgi:hypothetical protein
VGGVLSSGNGLGRGPAERRRGRDRWLRCLSGSLLAVGNAYAYADANSHTHAVSDFNSTSSDANPYTSSDANPYTSSNANSDPDSYTYSDPYPSSSSCLTL